LARTAAIRDVGLGGGDFETAFGGAAYMGRRDRSPVAGSRAQSICRWRRCSAACHRSTEAQARPRWPAFPDRTEFR
jgi:hypothetical protein